MVPLPDPNSHALRAPSAAHHPRPPPTHDPPAVVNVGAQPTCSNMQSNFGLNAFHGRGHWNSTGVQNGALSVALSETLRTDPDRTKALISECLRKYLVERSDGNLLAESSSVISFDDSNDVMCT